MLDHAGHGFLGGTGDVFDAATETANLMMVARFHTRVVTNRSRANVDLADEPDPLERVKRFVERCWRQAWQGWPGALVEIVDGEVAALAKEQAEQHQSLRRYAQAGAV
jgi:hypothetical protein